MSTESSLSSSPARSSSSTMAMIGGNVGHSSSIAVDDFPTNPVYFQDRKDETLQDWISKGLSSLAFYVRKIQVDVFHLLNNFLKYRHKTRVHIGQLVKDTSAKLKQASETDHHVEVSASKKITDAKLAKDFQPVLKEFQKAQRLAAERETAYTPFVPQAVLPPSYTASEIDVSMEKSPEQRALLVESRRQEVLLLDNEIAFNEAIIEEREQGIQEIQQQIGVK